MWENARKVFAWLKLYILKMLNKCLSLCLLCFFFLGKVYVIERGLLDTSTLKTYGAKNH